MTRVWRSVSRVMAGGRGTIYHSRDGFGLYQCPIKDFAKISPVPTANLAEVVNQGCVKEGELVAHAAKISPLEMCQLRSCREQ